MNMAMEKKGLLNGVKIMMVPRVVPEGYPDEKSLVLSRRYGR